MKWEERQIFLHLIGAGKDGGIHMTKVFFFLQRKSLHDSIYHHDIHYKAKIEGKLKRFYKREAVKKHTVVE